MTAMNLKWSLSLGKIAGIRISIHWTFLILMGWIFIMQFQSGHDVRQSILAVILILALFGCVTLHELGHALAAKRFHIMTKSITLLPIGGVAQMEKLPEKPSQELLVALAGPFVNVVIAVILYVWFAAIDQVPFPLQKETLENLGGMGFWYNLWMANLVLAVFNLIPAFPMDGGRVLRALLSFAYSRERATRIAASIGQFLAILFVFFGIFYNFWWVFIGVFVYLGAGAEAFMEVTKSSLAGKKVRDVMMRHFTPFAPDNTLGQVVEALLNGQEQEFVVMQDEKVTGIITRKELIRGLSQWGKEAPLSNSMIREFIILHPDMDLPEIFQKLMTDGSSVAPVMEDGKLVGIVDRDNINELILVQEAMASHLHS